MKKKIEKFAMPLALVLTSALAVWSGEHGFAMFLVILAALVVGEGS